ncbi:uncharacterized protein [Manis javanica]|uniref:uncharacterized protein n=1 Tax=Manis javanica TaxID=9974 RepID=UPI003C6D6F2A
MAASDARGEPVDRTPPSLAVVSRAPPAAHRAVGRTTTARLPRTSDVHRAGGHRPVSPGLTRCRGRHRRRPRPYPEVGRGPDGHATALGRDSYNRPRGPDEAVGRTTAGLPRASDAHREGGRRPASPGPTRCRGRHRRRPRPYPEVGRGPDGHAAALGRDSYNRPRGPDEAVGRTTAGLPRASDAHREGGRRPASPGPTRCRGRHRRRPRPYPEVGLGPDGHATAPGTDSYNCCPPDQDKAVGSTTVGLPCTSETQRAGGHPPASPGPTRCRGRRRRRPRPYPEVGRRADGHATALGRDSYHCRPGPDKAEGSCTAGLPRTSDADRAGGRRPASPGPTRCRGRHRRRHRPYPEVGIGPDGHATALGKDTYIWPQGPHKAVGTTTATPKAADDDEEEAMDTTPPWLAVTLRSPAAPLEAVGSTTAGLPRPSDAHRAGGHHRPASPGPTRCRGRHRRRPRPYPEVGLGPDGHAAALGRDSYHCRPGPEKAEGSSTAGLPRTSDADRAGGRRPASPGPTRCRGRHRRRPRPYPEVGLGPDGHAAALGKGTY